jgi:transposase
MARDFRAVDRDQPMLLPPDLRDWLPPDHLAWLVLEVVNGLDLSAIESGFKRGGTGRQAYDPRMLTTLLVYAYCHGVRSSRRIEQACVTDVAFRVLSAQQRPDHSTISRFRATHAEALAGLFGQVLVLCARAGLGQLATLAIDGSKIAGQASRRKNYSQATLETKLEIELRELAAGIVAEAGQVDAAEDAEDAEYGEGKRGDELPEQLAPGPGRAARIRAALDSIEQDKKAAVDADVAQAQRRVAKAQRRVNTERDKVAERHAKPVSGSGTRRLPFGEQAKIKNAERLLRAATERLDTARAGRGTAATRLAKQITDKQIRRNISDPDTRLMKVRGKGFIQGFNAQLAVSDDYLILATDVVNSPNDLNCFTPMLDQVTANCERYLPGRTIGTVLADSGYCTVDALTTPGPERLIATGSDPAKPANGIRHPALKQMAERLQPNTPDRATYTRRQATVEPVIGHLKDRLGLRQFSRRGLQAARHELALTALAHNIRRLALATLA